MRREVADIDLRAMSTRVSRRARMAIEFYDRRQRGILLVHGYNVNEEEAVRVLGGFRTALAYFAPALRPDTFTCTWAGNWNIPGLRPAAYPFMLRNANESADTLLGTIEDWYERPFAPEELVIVAHSLGCRLTLDMLATMEVQGRPVRLKRLTVILMAAAVPTAHIAGGGKLERALRVPDVAVVLHSQSDSVLSSVFGLGQTIARDGWFPEAVGLRGNPQGAHWSRTQKMPAFDHGDYWGELETAELVCRILGFSISGFASGVPLAARKLLAQHRGILSSVLPPHRS